MQVSNKIVFTDRNFVDKKYNSCVNFEYFQYEYLEKKQSYEVSALKGERLVSSIKQLIIELLPECHGQILEIRMWILCSQED